VVGLIGEKFSVMKERQRLEQDTRRGSSGGVELRGAFRAAQPRPEGPVAASTRCWSCPDILGGTVPRKPCGREKGSGPEAAVPSDSPLWVMLELKLGNVLALVDTGAQFSCVRSDVAEYL